jgi:lipopolysaccharide export system permease protein
VAAVALLVGLRLEPAGLRDARLRLNDVIRKNVTTDVRAGVFFEEIPDVTLYAERVEGGRWHHVLASDRSDAAAPLLALAQEGHIEPAGDGDEMRLVLDQGEVHREELRSDEYVAATFGRASISVGVGSTLSERNSLVGSPFELGPAQIAAVARERAARGDVEGARRWETFLHRRVAGPLAILAFGLLAVPIGALRRGGRALGYAATLVTVVAYYAVMRLGEGLSHRGALPTWAGPHLANAAFAAAGAILILLLARRGAGAVR